MSNDPNAIRRQTQVTDNAIVRWDGQHGSEVQNSVVTISDAGVVAGATIPAASISGFDEAAQDAVGAMVDGSLTYVDGTPLLQRAALTGDVTASAGSNTTAIADNAVTNTDIRDSAAVSVIGRSANSSGDPADIAAGSNDTILRRTSDALDFGQLTVGMAPNSLWTYAKIQNVTDARLLGNASGGAAAPSEITAGNGVALASSSLDVDLASTSGLEFTSGQLRVDVQNTDGLLAISASGLGVKRMCALHFGSSTARSASVANNTVDRVACTTTAGPIMPYAGRIVAASLAVNVTDAVDAAQTLTFQTRINNTTDTNLNLTILPADGTGDKSKTVTGVTSATFSAGAFITSFAVLSGGTTTWDEVVHIVWVEFDIA